jgi:hypothetical protein
MKAFIPELVNLDDRKMLTITSVGDPNIVGKDIFPILYGTAYGTKFKTFKPKGIKMELGKLCALWPDAHTKPKNQWTGIWAVPVPDFVTESDIIQKDHNQPVKLVVWPGGTYAQILHKGKYTDEAPTIKKLHEFIESNGIKIAKVIGAHEEEYLTSPDSKEIKTIIRYRIK